MKLLTEELKYRINVSHAGNFLPKSVSWSEIYDTEEELIQDMFHEKVKVDNCFYYELCKGYEFIKSFRKYYKKNGYLTEKQMTQLKRLAFEIAYRIYIYKA